MPIWVWLAAIVGCSAIVRILLARQVAAPWIMVDELIYSELAKSFAAGGHFQIRGAPSTGYGIVYPMLIAPAWRAFGSVPHAYAVAKGINAVVISLTAIPAYFLARRLVAPVLALVAAVLAVLVPSLLYAGTLMTENAFYPLFTTVCLLLVLTLERPTVWKQISVLALAHPLQAPRPLTRPVLDAIAGPSRRLLRRAEGETPINTASRSPGEAWREQRWRQQEATLCNTLYCVEFGRLGVGRRPTRTFLTAGL